jgi:hypothetical protein
VAQALTISILSDVSKAVQGIDSVDSKLGTFGDAAKRMGQTVAGAFSLSKIGDWAKEWVGAARDAAGGAVQVGVVFGDQAGRIKDYAKENANALGLSNAAYLQHAALAGNTLKNVGYSTDEAAKQTQLLIERAAAMSNVYGGDVTEALEKVEGIMRGRGLAAAKEWGLSIKESDVNARLAAKGLKDLAGDELNAAKEAERLAIFFEQTSAEGDRLAQGTIGLGLQMQQLDAKTTDAKATLGEAFLPIIKALLPIVNTLADAVGRYPKIFQAVVLVVLGLAAAFSIATLATGVFGVTMAAVFWPITAVIAIIAALIAIVVLLVKYWDQVSAAAKAAFEFVEKWWFLFGPLGQIVALVGVLARNWDTVTGAISAAFGVLQKLMDLAGKVGGLLSKIPGIGGSSIGGIGGAGAGTFGATPFGGPGFGVGSSSSGPVIQLTVNGDVGDPVILGRRMVAALDAYVATNGRDRLHTLLGA